MPAPNAGPNKRMEGPSGRARNTQTSNASRKPGVPSVPGFGSSFGSVAGASGSLATAWAALQNQLAISREQRMGSKAAFKTARAGARSEAIGAMSEAINTGIESGMTGSSNVAQSRIGVLADRRSAIEAAKTQSQQEILSSRQADMQQRQQFAITQAQIEMQAEAARQQAALQQQAIAAQQEASSGIMAMLAGMGKANSTPVYQAETKFGLFQGLKGDFKPWLKEQRGLYQTGQARLGSMLRRGL